MSDKLTWKDFIKKLITRILTIFIFWAIGSNFVYMAGRSKPNKYNNYSDAYNPGWFDWPFNNDYIPYNDSDPLSGKDLGQEEYKKFKNNMEKFKNEQSGGQFGGKKQTAWDSYLRQKFSSMNFSSSKASSKTPKRSKRRKRNKSRKVYRGGDGDAIDRHVAEMHKTAPVEGIPVEGTPVVEAIPVKTPSDEGAPNVDEDDKGNAANFLGLSLAAQTEIVKKIYWDFEKYYGKNGYGGETNTEETEDGKGRKKEKLGTLGKLYLNFGPTSNKYGFPYNLQQDGRSYTTTSGEKKNRDIYNDGTLFGDSNFDVKSATKNMNKFNPVFTTNNPSKKKEVGVDTKSGTGTVPPVTTTSKPVKSNNINQNPENKKKEPTVPSLVGGNKSNTVDGKKSEKERKDLPGIQDLPLDATIIDKLIYFVSGGWIKLFTGGAPDIFSWVQEKSWSTHRWMINGFLGLISVFYSDKPSGLMWLFIGLLIHISPMFLLTIFPYIYGFISYVTTFCYYYGYGLMKDNHILSGLFWAGNFFFLPTLLALVTWWIPIVNCFTLPISLITSLIPSLQTFIVPAITAMLQTFRTVIYLTFGHLFTPNGKQFYLGNIFGDYRYRGLFIFEIAVAVARTIQGYFPYGDENVRTAAAGSVLLSWGLFQLFAWWRGNSGWKGFWVDPGAPQKPKKTNEISEIKVPSERNKRVKVWKESMKRGKKWRQGQNK